MTASRAPANALYSYEVGAKNIDKTNTITKIQTGAYKAYKKGDAVLKRNPPKI